MRHGKYAIAVCAIENNPGEVPSAVVRGGTADNQSPGDARLEAILPPPRSHLPNQSRIQYDENTANIFDEIFTKNFWRKRARLPQHRLRHGGGVRPSPSPPSCCQSRRPPLGRAAHQSLFSACRPWGAACHRPAPSRRSVSQRGSFSAAVSGRKHIRPRSAPAPGKASGRSSGASQASDRRAHSFTTNPQASKSRWR